jgi:hypothetical protein
MFICSLTARQLQTIRTIALLVDRDPTRS